MLLSVIIPVYNVEEYIDQCIQSVVKQTYTNLEIILIDDGSPDNCPQICDNWSKKDKRIRVIHQKNSGLSAARNVGIDCSKGDLIAFVDSDDFIDENMYENMINAMKLGNADVVVCGRYIYSDKKIITKCCVKQIKIFNNKEAINELFIGKKIEEASWDKIYKKALFNGIRFPLNEINEDLVTIPYIFERAKKIVHVGNAYYYYRKNNFGISKSSYNEHKQVVIKHLKMLDEYFSDKDVCYKKSISLLKARYSYSILLSLSTNLQVKKKYESDYKVYLDMLKSNFFAFFMESSYLFIDKIKCILIITGLFNILFSIKYSVKNRNASN